MPFTLVFQVRPINDAPVGISDQLYILEDTPAAFVPSLILNNDEVDPFYVGGPKQVTLRYAKFPVLAVTHRNAPRICGLRPFEHRRSTKSLERRFRWLRTDEFWSTRRRTISRWLMASVSRHQFYWSTRCEMVALASINRIPRFRLTSYSSILRRASERLRLMSAKVNDAPIPTSHSVNNAIEDTVRSFVPSELLLTVSDLTNGSAPPVTKDSAGPLENVGRIISSTKLHSQKLDYCKRIVSWGVGTAANIQTVFSTLRGGTVRIVDADNDPTNGVDRLDYTPPANFSSNSTGFTDVFTYVVRDNGRSGPWLLQSRPACRLQPKSLTKDSARVPFRYLLIL